MIRMLYLSLSMALIFCSFSDLAAQPTTLERVDTNLIESQVSTNAIIRPQDPFDVWDDDDPNSQDKDDLKSDEDDGYYSTNLMLESETSGDYGGYAKAKMSNRRRARPGAWYVRPDDPYIYLDSRNTDSPAAHAFASVGSQATLEVSGNPFDLAQAKASKHADNLTTWKIGDAGADDDEYILTADIILTVSTDKEAYKPQDVDEDDPILFVGIGDDSHLSVFYIGDDKFRIVGRIEKTRENPLGDLFGFVEEFEDINEIREGGLNEVDFEVTTGVIRGSQIGVQVIERNNITIERGGPVGADSEIDANGSKTISCETTAAVMLSVENQH